MTIQSQEEQMTIPECLERLNAKGVEGIEFIEFLSERIAACASDEASAKDYAKSDYWVYPIVPTEETPLDDLRVTNWSVDGMVHYE
jgi:hypothetical protein